MDQTRPVNLDVTYDILLGSKDEFREKLTNRHQISKTKLRIKKDLNEFKIDKKTIEELKTKLDDIDEQIKKENDKLNELNKSKTTYEEHIKNDKEKRDNKALGVHEKWLSRALNNLKNVNDSLNSLITEKIKIENKLSTYGFN